MSSNFIPFIFGFFFFMLLSNCSRENGYTIREETPYYDDETRAAKWLDLSQVYTNNEIKLPLYLKDFGLITPESEDKLFALGRILFYDKNLSKDRTIACASCHLQQFAFADTTAFSKGVENKRTSRNSLALNNQLSSTGNGAAWGRVARFFWDNRAASIAEQTLETFANPHEMGISMPELLQRIKEQEYYAYFWKEKFNHFEPKETEVLQAITHFVNALGTFDSRFDKSLEILSDSFSMVGGLTSENLKGINLPLFTMEENQGKDVYMKKCARCHSVNGDFADVLQANTGLDIIYNDHGIFNITNNYLDEGVFKTPSLRNIEFTAPYMHDGRFKTLEKVVEFYSDSVKRHPNISYAMFQGIEMWGSPGFFFTNEEKQNLVAFLKTLSDKSIRSEQRFSSPFLK
jgi:cytochrome c peroxidase